MNRNRMSLFRPMLSLMNGCAALAGYLYHAGLASSASLLSVFAGVVLLAAGGSALNQVMETGLDRLMARTSQRPLPAGRISRTAALLSGLACVAGGTLLLLVSFGAGPALLGLLALVIYLALYTPLKRRTGLVLAIGAVSGALPPVIGFWAAGGEPGDVRALLLAGIFYLWQMPHFWVQQRDHAADYAAAGCRMFPRDPLLPGLVRLWILALLAASALLPLFQAGRGNGAIPLIAMLPLVACLGWSRSGRHLLPLLHMFPLVLTLSLAVRSLF